MMHEPSRFCFGCEPLGGTDWGNVSIPDIELSIYEALDRGINFFDTASAYGLGLSEERLSRILGPKRHSTFIATKGGLSWEASTSSLRTQVYRDCSPVSLRRNLESSLQRLRLDAIPLYYIHWPDNKTDIYTAIQTLSEFKKAGLIQAIGLSNHSIDQVKEAVTICPVDYVQIPLNLFQLEHQLPLLYFCHDHKIRVAAYNVLASGLLTSKYNESTVFPTTDRRSRLKSFSCPNTFNSIVDFTAIASQHGQNLLQYAITQVLSLPAVSSVVLGIKSSSQLLENLSAVYSRT